MGMLINGSPVTLFQNEMGLMNGISPQEGLFTSKANDELFIVARFWKQKQKGTWESVRLGCTGF